MLASTTFTDVYDIQTGSNVTFKQIMKAGTYYIVNESDSSKYIKTITVKSGQLPELSTISGTVVDNSSRSPNLTIDRQPITESFSIQVLPGKYSVVCDSDFVNVEIKDSGSQVIQEIDATSNVENLTITLSDKPVTTLSGTVDANLTTSGDIAVTGEGFSGTATIGGGSYSIEVPQNNTYTLSLDTNEGYLASQYTIQTNTVSVDTEAKEHNLVGEKITEWDFSKLPAHKFEGKTGTGTFKGIEINATNGKFDAQPASNRVQFNTGTTAKITIADGQKLIVDTTKHQSTISYEGTTATIANNGTIDDYITSIKIVSKEATELATVEGTGVAGAVYADQNDSYVIAVITDDTGMAEKSSFDIKIGNATVSTPTVYKSVSINGKPIEANTISNGKYLFAIQVTGAQGRDAVNTFEAALK